MYPENIFCWFNNFCLNFPLPFIFSVSLSRFNFEVFLFQLIEKISETKIKLRLSRYFQKLLELYRADVVKIFFKFPEHLKFIIRVPVWVSSFQNSEIKIKHNVKIIFFNVLNEKMSQNQKILLNSSKLLKEFDLFIITGGLLIRPYGVFVSGLITSPPVFIL